MKKNEGLFHKAINFITSFMPVLSASPEGGGLGLRSDCIQTGGVRQGCIVRTSALKLNLFSPNLIGKIIASMLSAKAVEKDPITQIH